jgi:cell division protease FtsH
MYLDSGGPGLSTRPYAESTQAVIDREVSRLLREAEERAVDLLKGHESQLDQLASLLIDQETVSGEEVYRLLGLAPPERIDDAPTIAPHRVPADQRTTGSPRDGQHVPSHRAAPPPAENSKG